MSTPGSLKRRTLRLSLLLGLFALSIAMLAPSRAALAHPLDIYLQASYITVGPTQIVVELDLSPGVLVAPKILPQIDTDGDQQISDADGRAYVDTVLGNVVLDVDGQPQALTVTSIDMPTYLNIQAGYGTLRVFTKAGLAAGMTGSHRISFTNNYTPTGSAYQVNAFVDDGVPVTLGTQNRDCIQQSMTMDYAIGGSASTGTGSSGTSAKTSAGTRPEAASLS
jgi:hypothetical protein